MTIPVSTDVSAVSRVPVSLGERSYEIVIGDDLLSQAGTYLKPILRSSRVAILTDENVAPLHLERLTKSLGEVGIDHISIILPAGESSKSLATYEKVMDQLLEAKIQRDEALIALGGGVIGDLTGFAASTLRRGIDFIQIPTTLLSQVDSSVGGKTGINAPQGKNLIGAFYQPKLVLADVGLLSSLPKRELLAGYAEVVKYGLLGDFDFFGWLEANGPAIIQGDITARIKAVEKSVKAKAAIVAQDEREGGVRALLNLGHTFGHALEAETGYGPYLNHGEAVAIGIIMAAELSVKMGLLSGQEGNRIHSHFQSVGLPQKVPNIVGLSWQSDRLLDHMRQDKKVSAGKLTFILLKAIGNAFTTQDVAVPDVLDVLTIELSSAN
ncbi:MAG: 3-dehydroquinate synthase [Sneathiella sp.]|uniref:3-dehydroquinate synthase n=1 Tax=Sneathiella sp. TaxID=1964365 RepID=UPI0030032D6D